MEKLDSGSRLTQTNPGAWLEFWFIPTTTVCALASTTCAVWAALAGSVRGIPWWGLVPYAFLASSMGVGLTALYKTRRAEGPGRQFEALLLCLIPLVWHWGLRVATRHAPGSLPVVGTESGMPSALLLAVLGVLTWACGVALGGLCAALWPERQGAKVSWLAEIAPEMAPDEKSENEAKEAKARIFQAETGIGPYTGTVFALSLLLLAIVLARGEDEMPSRGGFMVWGLIQAFSALVGSAAYLLAVKRLTWSLHRTVVESGVVRSWLLALVLTVLLVLPLGAGIRTITVHVMPPRTLTDPSGPPPAPPESGRDIEGGREHKVGGTREARPPNKTVDPKELLEAKTKKTPEALRTVWNILAGVVLLGVLATSLLMGLSLIVLLLLAIVNIVPGLSGSLHGMRGARASGLIAGLLWPLSVIGELVASGLRDTRDAIRHALHRGDARRGAAYSISRGLTSAGRQLASMRKSRQLKADLKSSSPEASIRFHYSMVLLRAERRGLHRQPGDTAGDLRPRLSNPPDLRDEVSALTDAFEAARYGQHAVTASLADRCRGWARSVLLRFRSKRGG